MNDQLSDAEIDAEADQGYILLQTREAQREALQNLDALSAKLKVLAGRARMQQRVTALCLLLVGFAIGFALVLAFAEGPAEPANRAPHAIDPNHARIFMVPPSGGAGNVAIVSFR